MCPVRYHVADVLNILETLCKLLMFGNLNVIINTCNAELKILNLISNLYNAQQYYKYLGNDL